MFRFWSSAKGYFREMLECCGLIEPRKFQSAKDSSFKVQKQMFFSDFWYLMSVREILFKVFFYQLAYFLSFWINARVKSVRAIWCFFFIAFMPWKLCLKLLVISFATAPHFTNVMNDKATVNNSRDSLKFKGHHSS